MSEITSYHRIQTQIDRLEYAFNEEMNKGNYNKAAEVALNIFALFKGSESCDRSRQKSELTKKLEETSSDLEATYNKKWKMLASVSAGGIQIAAGCAGIICPIGGAITSSAVLTGLGSAVQPVSYAGQGIESAANALYSPTQGKQGALNAVQEMQRTERDEAKAGKDSANQAKSTAFESLKEILRNKFNTISAILRG